MPDFRFCSKVISIHALREEGDADGCGRNRVLADFYPRPPRGGRRKCDKPRILMIRFLSTPSARRATVILHVPSEAFPISIHALREEGDSTWIRRNNMAHNFYPRPPRGGRLLDARAQDPEARISIHALREEGDAVRPGTCHCGVFISIHALREEGDGMGYAPRGTWQHFYPRPPRGGRLMIATTRCKGGRISIHALREEGDGSPSSRWITVFRFLSTPSARRATPCRRARYQTSQISIHALREEGDRLRFVFLDDDFGFLSTPSARRATNEMVKDCWAEKFLSTPSARRATPLAQTGLSTS